MLEDLSCHTDATLLQLRFGPLDEAVVAWVRHAGLEALDRMVERILTAPDLASLFAEDDVPQP